MKLDFKLSEKDNRDFEANAISSRLYDNVQISSYWGESKIYLRQFNKISPYTQYILSFNYNNSDNTNSKSCLYINVPYCIYVDK